MASAATMCPEGLAVAVGLLMRASRHGDVCATGAPAPCRRGCPAVPRRVFVRPPILSLGDLVNGGCSVLMFHLVRAVLIARTARPVP